MGAFATREVGSEEIYHQGLVQLLKDRDIPFRSKPRKTITHRGIEVQIFECDLIVRDLIVLELKLLPFATFAAGHYAQLFHYLKCWNKDLGLLVNFGPTRAQIERFVWDEPELEIREDYDAISCVHKGCQCETRKEKRDAILPKK